MDNSWVKLYRKIRDHDVIKDANACQVLLWLFTGVDKRTGILTTGRFVASEWLGMNPSTFYKVLKRLEEKYKIVTLTSNNKFTTISLLNWAKYNDYPEKVTQISNNKVTTKEQQSNNKVTLIQDIKTIDIKTIDKSIDKSFGKPEINELKTYFLLRMGIPTEDCSQKQSRQYWNLLLRESKDDVKGVRWLIDVASQDNYFRNNITSSKALYYNRVKLIARKRGELNGDGSRVSIDISRI